MPNAPEPIECAPPWIHTITGASDERSAGAHTLSTRQSSLVTRSRFHTPASASMSSVSSWPVISPTVICGHDGPYSTQPRTPSQGATGWGGRNLLAPPVSAP